MTIQTDRRPIGFWLKLVDRLIDGRLDGTLGDLTRRHWQVLNVVQQGQVGQCEIDARVQPFLSGESTAAQEVADLRERGWIAGADVLALTERGRTEFQRVLSRVSTERASMMAGIAPEEYASTVSVLERIARNLGWTPSDRPEDAR